MGAYLGLLGIGAAFAAIGVFASTMTNNQIISFLLGAFLSFLLFAAFDFMALLPALESVNSIIMQLGMNEHYRSISRGVIDSRDVLYFLSLIILFLIYAKALLSGRRV